MIERCGDRQRKFNGLEKWPFRIFIEGLPIMLQVALFLLTCGLSRYMWSVNTSVARVVICFTLLGFLFYVGIVIAGTCSYECPFQTPVSIALRHLKDSGTKHKLLSNLSPLYVVPFVYVTWKKTRESLVTLSSLICAAWMDSHQGLVSASRRAYNVIRHPLTWEFSPSQIPSDTHNTVRNTRHRAVILLLKMDRKLGNAKQRMVQGIRRFMRTGLLPTSTKDVNHEPMALHNGQGLRVPVWNLQVILRQNADNARCVSWVLRNITDPEALDAAIRLAGTIRWFDGDSHYDPPLDVIVSAFEACFDSTKQPYPGMRDRAYFSGRAILQINMRARTRSREHASKYPIPTPTISSTPFRANDFDLHHVVWMLESNAGDSIPILPFPKSNNTRAHSLWLSNLLVDLTRTGPNPILGSYWAHLAIAEVNHRPIIANILVMWYMLLGGHVEEETFWAVDKSYAVVSFLLPEYLTSRRDSLETILSALSRRVMEVIVDGNRFKILNYLFDFLAAWEERPVSLTSVAYEWCSAISEVAGQLGLDGMHTDRLHRSSDFKAEFPQVGSNYGPSCLDNTSHIRDRLQGSTPGEYLDFLTPLEVAFRLVGPGCNELVPLNHTPHHDRIFETAFSSLDDEVVADAACAWIIFNPEPAGSFARYFAKRVGNVRPFSSRLRWAAIRVIEDIGVREVPASGLEIVRLLNRLDVGASDLDYRTVWHVLLVGVIRSPMGENLTSHYWRLLGELAPTEGLYWEGIFGTRDVEVMRLLEEAEDWEKLEVWMAIVWGSLRLESTPELLEAIGDVTLKLLLSQPSAIQRFEKPMGVSRGGPRAKFREVLNRARVGRLPSEPRYQHPPYVSVHSSPFLSVLTSPFPFQPIGSHPATRSSSFCCRRHFLRMLIVRGVYYSLVYNFTICTRAFFELRKHVARYSWWQNKQVRSGDSRSAGFPVDERVPSPSAHSSAHYHIVGKRDGI